MKQKTTIYCLLATILLLSSCKSDEDTWATTLYGDAVINSFTLGTLNRYVNGEKKTITGSDYVMEIDPLTRTIQNPDSLPIYTDAAHVICSVSTLNNGYVYIKNVADDAFPAYSSSDSIDFTQDRIFRVWASDGSGYNDYLVKLNIHKEDGDVLEWKTASDPGPVPVPAGLKQYLGKSSFEEYGLSADNKVMAKATGATAWSQDLPDDHEDIAHFPTQDMALTSYAMTMADSTDYVLLVGTCNGATAVWRKIVDYTKKQPKGTWTYLDRGSETIGLLPALTSLSIIRYDGVVLAFGGDFKTIYESRDNGITWKKSTRIAMPADFDYDNTATMVVTTDSDNYIWLRCTMTDASVKVWKGRLTRLGWKK